MTQTVPDISPLMPMHQDPLLVKILRPRQNGRHFPDDIFKCILLNENIWILIEVSLKFVPILRLQLTTFQNWFRSWFGDKPLYEPIMVSLLTHICVTWLQWFNVCKRSYSEHEIFRPKYFSIKFYFHQNKFSYNFKMIELYSLFDILF